jgi:hypothetical protein
MFHLAVGRKRRVTLGTARHAVNSQLRKRRATTRLRPCAPPSVDPWAALAAAHPDFSVFEDTLVQFVDDKLV